MSKIVKEIVENDVIKLGSCHKGYKHERMMHSDNSLERIFHNEWRKENKHRSYINHGWGILQDLFALPPRSSIQKMEGLRF
jgi:hypothetical protein